MRGLELRRASNIKPSNSSREKKMRNKIISQHRTPSFTLSRLFQATQASLLRQPRVLTSTQQPTDASPSRRHTCNLERSRRRQIGAPHPELTPSPVRTDESGRRGGATRFRPCCRSISNLAASVNSFDVRGGSSFLPLAMLFWRLWLRCWKGGVRLKRVMVLMGCGWKGGMGERRIGMDCCCYYSDRQPHFCAYPAIALCPTNACPCALRVLTSTVHLTKPQNPRMPLEATATRRTRTDSHDVAIRNTTPLDDEVRFQAEASNKVEGAVLLLRTPNQRRA
jgi:hypothetical protein